MRVFVTGATGYVGSAVVDELKSHGYEVVGLARSDESAKKLESKGVQVLRGSLEDLDVLKKGAKESDAVLHLGFIHDFANFDTSARKDKEAIEALGSALEGSEKPFIVSSGLLFLSPPGEVATEDMTFSPDHPRKSEIAVQPFSEKGVKTSAIRLSPTVHGKDDPQFVNWFVDLARKSGQSIYTGKGESRWCAVSRQDAAVLYRLVLEKGRKGGAYHAVSEQGIEFRKIAEQIGEKLQVPAVSVTAEEQQKIAGPLTMFFSDMTASSDTTQKELGWKPTGSGLLEDIKQYYN